ncbi:helix-turn-helix domain-containing protein [Candidatus Ruminimicrobium bovinum]|uniref:helix-turn-helix domain-containing protein n=1 Tax=Candidatus Ruminimicrobium bovinum TaxID=3242779 RepID=UPI0039B83FF8
MIILRLDMIMARERVSLQDLADKIGITNANLSNIKNGKVKAIRFSTLNSICKELNCQPGDILEYVEDM